MDRDKSGNFVFADKWSICDQMGNQFFDIQVLDFHN